MTLKFAPETDSALPHYSKCPGAAALVRIDSDNEPARMGNAIHHHMELRVSLGLDLAIAALLETAEVHGLDETASAIFVARCRSFKWLPPAGALSEVPLVMWEDGDVTRIEGGKGKYRIDRPYQLPPGTIDIMWSEPEPLDVTDPEHPRCPPGSVLWVADYKSGDDVNVDPVETNLQIASAACKAAAWTGALRVRPVVLFTGPGDGSWDTPRLVWGTPELADARARVRAVLEATSLARHVVAAFGGLPELRVGRQCTYCASEMTCPQKTALIKSLVGKNITPNGMLTAEDRIWAVQFLGAFERAARDLRSALKRDVDVNGPIRTPVGTWGARDGERRTIDARRALPILREVLGAEIADQAIDMKITSASLDEGVKQAMAAGLRGPSIGKIRARIWRKLEDAGVLRTVARETYGLYRTDEDDPIAQMREESGE